MFDNVPKVIESASKRIDDANKANIKVFVYIFSNDVVMYEFEAGQCPPLTSEIYRANGNTALYKAMNQAFQKAAAMSADFQILIVIETDGVNNIDDVTIFELRDQYAALKQSHPGFSALMCSSGPEARVLGSQLGLFQNQVIELDESRRDFGAVALQNAQRDYFSSEPGSAAAFSHDDIMSSEPPQHWQFSGSSAHSYGGASDNVPSAYD
jgi:hypothetical protein